MVIGSVHIEMFSFLNPNQEMNISICVIISKSLSLH